MIRNTENSYGAVAKFFHWLIAALILANLALGLIMEDAAMGPGKFRLFFWHKSIGACVLILASLRLLWTLYNGWPRALPTHARWERMLAKMVHILLYGCMLTLPLSGWLLSSAKGMGVSVFGWFTLPNLIAPDKNIVHLAARYHVITAWVLMVLIGLHVLGALKHWLLDRDDTLRRMLPFAKVQTPLLTVMLFSLISSAHAVEPVTAWTIDPLRSHVTFTASQELAPFTGTIPHFTGTIAFDPDRLNESQALITLPLADVTTGSGDRDQYIGQKPWLDVLEFPVATYTTTSFEKTPTGYLAHGVLTLRGVQLPVELPFLLKIGVEDGHKIAVLRGTAALDRLQFGIGTGEWADPKTVGTDVRVNVELVATAP